MRDVFFAAMHPTESLAVNESYQSQGCLGGAA